MPYPYPVLTPLAHRSFPPPRSPWVAKQLWEDLLFLNYPIAPEALATTLPTGLLPDVFEGQAWVSIVPFNLRMAPRGCPKGYWPLAFAELNVRTYVVAKGVPGVFFYSLDASDPVAVAGARWLYQLPYFNAQCALHHNEGSRVTFTSRRRHKGAPASQFIAHYTPTDTGLAPHEAALAQWLTSRWCFFTANRWAKLGGLIQGHIHHEPWPLQPAHVDLETNTLLADWQLPVKDTSVTAYYASRVHVVNWLPATL